MFTKAAASIAASSYRVFASISDEIAKERRLRLEDGSAWGYNFGRTGAAGKMVTRESAMRLSAFWACVRMTAQAVSTLPMSMYEKKPNGSRERAGDHELADIIERNPNSEQTALEFWEGMIAWLLVDGNACAQKLKIGNRVVGLKVLPGAVPRRNQSGELVYRYVDRNKPAELPSSEVFHIRGFGWGGDSGLSAVQYGVQTFSTALAAFETSGRMFSNGLSASGVLTTDQVGLKDAQRTQLNKIMDEFVGSERAGKLMILEAGLKYQQLTMSPVDAQLLEQQRFSIEEICRWFGMPPVVIGHAAQGQTMWGSGVEQILLTWLALGINPLCERIERRITKQLIAVRDQKRFYAEFNREAIMQMDSKTKAAFLSTVVQNGLMDRNEGRDKLNLPRRTGADELTAQTNLAPLDKLGEAAAGNQARESLRNWLADPKKEEANDDNS